MAQLAIKNLSKLTPFADGPWNLPHKFHLLCDYVVAMLCAGHLTPGTLLRHWPPRHWPPRGDIKLPEATLTSPGKEYIDLPDIDFPMLIFKAVAAHLVGWEGARGGGGGEHLHCFFLFKWRTMSGWSMSCHLEKKTKQMFSSPLPPHPTKWVKFSIASSPNIRLLATIYYLYSWNVLIPPKCFWTVIKRANLLVLDNST